MAGQDKARHNRSLEMLNEILAEIVTQADEDSLLRCPYKNAEDRCTAHFKCRYQRPPAEPDELKVCSSDDKLNYRSAWEVDSPQIDPSDRDRPSSAPTA